MMPYIPNTNNIWQRLEVLNTDFFLMMSLLKRVIIQIFPNIQYLLKFSNYNKNVIRVT